MRILTIVIVMCRITTAYGNSVIALEENLQKDIFAIELDDSTTVVNTSDYYSQMTRESFSELKNDALSGDPEKLRTIGIMCLNGFRVEKDHGLGGRIMMALAQAGNVDGMRFVGSFYHRGIGRFEQNYSEAFRWYEMAFNEGSVSCAKSIAELYKTGDSTLPVNQKKSDEWRGKYESMVMSQEKPSDLYRLALDYYQKGSDPDSIGKSVSLFEKAANQSHFPSMLKLVQVYLDGVGVEKNRDIAQQWIDRAVKLRGEKVVLKSLSEVYPADERDEVVQDLLSQIEFTIKESDVEIEELKKKALSGDLDSKRALVNLYLAGRKVDEDPRKALELSEEAAVMGDVGSMYKTGEMYRRGIGEIHQDLSKAELWYKKAVALGDLNSAIALCEMYYKGEVGSPTHIEKAEQIEKLIEEQYSDNGTAIQLYRLGRHYLSGTFRAVEYDKAYDYLERSAVQGYPPAMICLAKAYYFGRGVEVSQKEARDWFESASAIRIRREKLLSLLLEYESEADQQLLVLFYNKWVTPMR